VSVLADLEAEVLALATALGLTTLGQDGSHALNADFFAHPLTALRGILSNASQREGLLQALDAFVPPVPPAVLDGDGTRYHPLLGQGNAGQLYLKVTAGEALVDVGLAAELRGAGATAPALTVDVPLVRGADGSLTVLLADGAAGPPLKVALRVPMSNPDGAITGSLLLGGQAQAGTFRIELTQPAHDGSGPQTLVFDPLAGLRGAAPLLAGILEALGGRVATPEPVLQALPALLGLAGGLPPLPLTDLTHDPAAMRGWLKGLAQDTLPDGRSAIVVWLTAIGQLLDAAVTGGTGGGPPPESDPLRLVLVDATAGVPGVTLTAGLRTAPDSATSVLVIGVRIEAHAPAVDAQLLADVALLAMPLSGTAPATVIERLDLAVAAPAGSAQLLPSTSTPAGAVAVGGLRAGVSYRAGAFAALLELTDVVLAGQTHPLLDLLDARSLTAALKDDLVKAISAGISGAASNPLADALLTLLGLTPGANPAIDPALLATAPTRALADYFRRLRSAPAGWTPILSALGTLLGNPPGTALAGSGSATDPWRVSLTRFTAPAGALPTLSLALWDAAPPGAAGPMLRLGLALSAQAAGTPPPWTAAVTAALVSVDLPAGGGGAVQWLGQLDANLTLTPPGPQPGDALALEADEIAVQVSWRPSASLAAQATVRALTLSNGTATVALGDVALPPPGGFDPGDPALGFAAGAEAVWAATRLLLARAAGSWGGPAGTALAALLGLATPGTLGLPPELPPLAPPTATDLRTLLRDPLRTLGGWMAAMLADSALTADGAALVDTLRWPLQALLTDTVPLTAERPAYLDLPPAGYGTAQSPWTLPLQAAGSPAVELLCWVSPDGPPAGWADPALALLGKPPDTSEPAVPDPQLPDIETVAEAVSLLAPYLDVPEWALAEPGALAGALGALDAALAGTDGVVPAGAAQPSGADWTAGPVVIAAHHQLPRAPEAVNAVLGEIDRLTAGMGRDLWSALLIAPPLAGAGCWDPLLSQASVADAVSVDLSAAGSDPAALDLSGLAAAGHYVLDFGARPMALADAAGRLGQAVTAVRRVKPGGKVVLIAHSYLAVAATQFVADLVAAGEHPTDVIAGLITLGAPLAPVEVPAFDAGGEAEGLRWAQRLAPNGLPGASSLEAALDHLAVALDTIAAAGAGPGVAPAYPVDAFQWAADPLPGLGGVGAVALAGQLETSLGLALAGALAQSVAGGDPATGLGYGARVDLALPPPADEPMVEVTVRLDVGTLALLPQTSLPPPPRVVVTTRLWDQQGWLLGDGDGGDGTRLRAAEVTVRIAAGGTELSIRLDDVAHNGMAASTAELSDPLGPAVFAKLLTRLQSAAAQAPAGRCAALLGVLAQLDLVPKGAGANADAFGALLADPGAYLKPRIVPLLDGGVLGLSGAANARPGSGPWTLDVDLGRGAAQKPAQLVIEPTPWRVSIRTDPSGDGLHTAAGGRASATMTVRLDQPSSSAHGSLAVLGLGLSRDPASEAVSLSGPWFDAPLTLRPADPATLEPVLARSLMRLLIDAALTVVAERHFDGALIGSLSEFVAHPAAWLLRDGALGSSDPAAGPIGPAAANQLLGALARAGGLATSDTAPVMLPGGLVLSANAAGGGASAASAITMTLAAPLTLSAGTGTAALTLQDLHAGVTLDRALHATLAGGLTLQIPLPGDWQGLELSLEAAADGLHLGVTLDRAGSPIAMTLLPRVTGVDELLAQLAASLLTDALDALVEHTPTTSTGRKIALEAATALGLYTQAAGFDPAKLAALTSDLAQGSPQLPATTLVTALGGPLSGLLNGSGITISSSAKALSAAVTLSGLGPDAHVELTADFAPLDNTPPAPPTLSFVLASLAAGPPASPLLTAELDATCSWPAGAHQPVIATAANLGLSIDTGLGVVLRPALNATLAAGKLSITLLPVPADTAAAIELAPAPGIAQPDQLLVALAEEWAAPIAAALLLTSGGEWLDHPLWQPQSGGAALTARALLKDAQLLTSDGGHIQAVPTPGKLLQGLLGALGAIKVPLAGTLALTLDQSAIGGGGFRYGLRLTGEVAVPAGDYTVTLGFGLPAGPADLAAALQQLQWGATGVGLAFVELASDGTVKFAPALSLGGLGVGLQRGPADAKLIDTSAFSLGAAAAYLDTNIALTAAAPKADPLRGAVVLKQIGLPFLSPSAADDQDPVVSSLLAPAAGDRSSTNPPLDLILGTAVGGALEVLVNDQPDSPQPHWFPVHRGFGPVYIDQIGLAHPAASAEIHVDLDASVGLAGLTVSFDNLALVIPLAQVARPAGWSVGLDGLGIQFAAPDVLLLGSLVRTGSGASTEYDGSLAATVAGRGFSALAGFSRPADGSDGSYLSLFAFVSINTPLGGPPLFFVLALAGGAGYNRQLVVPTDPLAVCAFPLVATLSGGAVSTGGTQTVQQALAPLRNAIPARRGSYWVAAGVRFTTFALLETSALAYVALDRGVELGVLGVSRLVLPQQDLAASAPPILNAELAVNARFDSTSQVLSVRAQLTDHSWVLSKDCQLTGGFAFVIWFGQHRFVLTLGGYAPEFTPAADLPVVPRVGFHWAVSDTITVKGEVYFALLPSCVMLGGRLEASLGSGSISVWFIAWLDVLVSWDPFSYHADLGVSIGAKFSMQVCVIWCVTIDVEVSLGALVTIDGPPLHGRAHVDLAVASVDVDFGLQPPATVPHLQWGDFASIHRFCPVLNKE